MMKVTALYTPPSDAEAFEAHYLSVHGPLVESIPGLLRLETARAIGNADGTAAPYYRTADMYFEDLSAVQAGFSSEQGRATAHDAGSLAARTGSTLTIMISEVDAS